MICDTAEHDKVIQGVIFTQVCGVPETLNLLNGTNIKKDNIGEEKYSRISKGLFTTAVQGTSMTSENDNGIAHTGKIVYDYKIPKNMPNGFTASSKLHYQRDDHLYEIFNTSITDDQTVTIDAGANSCYGILKTRTFIRVVTNDNDKYYSSGEFCRNSEACSVGEADSFERTFKEVVIDYVGDDAKSDNTDTFKCTIGDNKHNDNLIYSVDNNFTTNLKEGFDGTDITLDSGKIITGNEAITSKLMNTDGECTVYCALSYNDNTIDGRNDPDNPKRRISNSLAAGNFYEGPEEFLIIGKKDPIIEQNEFGHVFYQQELLYTGNESEGRHKLSEIGSEGNLTFVSNNVNDPEVKKATAEWYDYNGTVERYFTEAEVTMKCKKPATDLKGVPMSMVVNIYCKRIHAKMCEISTLFNNDSL